MDRQPSLHKIPKSSYIIYKLHIKNNLNALSDGETFRFPCEFYLNSIFQWIKVNPDQTNLPLIYLTASTPNTFSVLH